MIHKIGDRVRVIPLEELQRISSKSYGTAATDYIVIDDIELNPPMQNFCNREAIIVMVNEKSYHLQFEKATRKSYWSFSEGMVSLMPDALPIQNNSFNEELL